MCGDAVVEDMAVGGGHFLGEREVLGSMRGSMV